MKLATSKEQKSLFYFFRVAYLNGKIKFESSLLFHSSRHFVLDDLFGVNDFQIVDSGHESSLFRKVR